MTKADEPVEIEGTGLILECEDDVYKKTYSNQSGGYACYHPELSGQLVTIELDPVLQKLITGFFTGPKYGGWCKDGIDHETAYFINTVLEITPAAKGWQVDMTMLEKSMEAWIYIQHKTNSKKGVFFFENSD